MEWLAIKGYDKYIISNNGIIRNYIKGNVLKPFKDKDGYLLIKLSNSDGIRGFRVHRLVAMHFIDNTDNKPEVNHKNGIKDDNLFSNLEWVTARENSEHKIKTGLSNLGCIRKDNKVNAVGISKRPNGKFVAQCQLNKKKYHIGLFLTLSEAIQAYNDFTKVLFKEVNIKNRKVNIMKNLTPMILLKDRILVLPDVTEEKTVSGLYIPEVAKEKPVEGTIIAISALVTSLKVGDKITYGKYTGTPLIWDDQEMLIMHETDPFGLVHE